MSKFLDELFGNPTAMPHIIVEAANLPTPIVRFVRTDKGAILPAKQREGDAAYDLYAVLEKPIVMHSFDPTPISTGWKIAIPPGFEGQVRPRSGLAKHGITVANSPGTIDSNYRGDLVVLLVNNTDGFTTIRDGDRIAQLLIKEVPVVDLVEVESFDDETERGEDGFGSSGR